jgi:ribosomal-protein-alanine N-acetyltransferase
MSRAARATPSEPAVEFRPCRERDLGGIGAIERATFPEPWTRDQFAALLAHPAGIGWVAEVVPRGTVGYAFGWVAADEAELADLAVQEQVRGRGVGTGLVRAFAREAGVRGGRRLYLEVRASNVGAQRFYHRLGFDAVGRRVAYYRHPREDALVMRAELPLAVDRPRTAG